MTVPVISNSGNTTLRLVSDNSTTRSLAEIIGVNCISLMSGNQSVVAFDSGSNSTNTSSGPFPEQAVQYYRASSIVLTLDGYSNTDVFNINSNTSVPMPSWADQKLLQCANLTIGKAAPLIHTPLPMPSWEKSAIAGGILGLLTLICCAKPFLNGLSALCASCSCTQRKPKRYPSEPPPPYSSVETVPSTGSASR